MIKIKHRSKKSDDRENNHDTSYHFIDDKDSISIKLTSDLIDEPSESKPPQQGTKHNTQISHSHFYRHIRNHKGKLCKGSHKEKHDERIAQGNQESRYSIML